MNIKDLSPEQLRKAAQIKEQIESLESQLQTLLGDETANGRKIGKKRSAATIARMKSAQKARWAKKGVAAAGKPAEKRKRTMSAAAKKKISEATKARWARIKAAKE